MKILKHFMNLAAVSAVVFSLTACGGDEDEPEQGGGGNEPIENPDPQPTPDPDDNIAAKDPAAAKSYLENTAVEFLNIINPADQETLVRIVGYWSENYSEYGAPANWNLDALEDYGDYYFQVKRHNPLRNLFSGLGKAARGDVAAMSRVMNEVLNVTRFSGIYEPGHDEEWVKTGESNDVIFKFFCNGNIVEVKATGSDGSWNMAADGVSVEVPHKVTLTLKNGSTTLVDATCESNLDFGTSVMNVNLNVSLCNVNFKSSVKGNNNRIDTETYAFYGSRQVARATASVEGKDMLDLKAIESLFRKETETYPWGEETWYEFDEAQAARMFLNGTTDSDVLGKVRVAGKVTGFGRLLASAGDYFDSDEYDSSEEAKNACQKQADLLKQLVDVNLYLEGSANSSAEVGYQPYYYGDEYGYYWEWYNEPVLLFPDGTTTSIEGYFGGNNFMGLETPLRTIIYAYEGYWLNH